MQERLTRAGAPLQSPSGFPQLCSCACLPTGLPFSSPAASSPGRRAREGSCSRRERHSHLGCQPARLCLPPAPGAGSTAPLHLVSVTSSSAGVLAHGLWAAGGQLESGPLPRHSLPEAARAWRTKAHSETACILDPSDGPLPLHSCRPLWELADAYLVSDLSRPTASVFFSGGCGMRRCCCSKSTGATRAPGPPPRTDSRPPGIGCTCIGMRRRWDPGPSSLQRAARWEAAMQRPRPSSSPLATHWAF